MTERSSERAISELAKGINNDVNIQTTFSSSGVSVFRFLVVLSNGRYLDFRLEREGCATIPSFLIQDSKDYSEFS